MKTFLNVLYRRILYKIPLKLLLVLLAVFGLLFAYSKADLVLVHSDTYNLKSQNYDYTDYYYNSDILCMTAITCNGVGLDQQIVYNFDGGQNSNGVLTREGVLLGNQLGICTTGQHIYYYAVSQCQFTFNAYNYVDYTSQQCQSEYNLIPINEVDSSYCQSNNLCPSGGTPSDCPNVGVSNIWINDIFHPGAFNVIMNIPEEIDRDYAYTNSGQNMNIDVVGYNVDYDYIEGVVDHQNYKPTSEEFSIIVSQIIPLFVPGLCIILLLYFIFRFIKKIF